MSIDELERTWQDGLDVEVEVRRHLEKLRAPRPDVARGPPPEDVNPYELDEAVLHAGRPRC